MFVGPVQDVLSDYMSDMVDEPSGGYCWYRYTATGEHDLQTILESVFLIEGKDEYDQSLTGLDYKTMSVDESTISNLKPTGVADAYFASRTFRGSIEKSFTKLFKDLYDGLYTAGMVLKPTETAAIGPWNNDWFAQDTYDALSTDDAYDLLVANLSTVIAKIEAFKDLAD